MHVRGVCATPRQLVRAFDEHNARLYRSADCARTRSGIYMLVIIRGVVPHTHKQTHAPVGVCCVCHPVPRALSELSDYSTTVGRARFGDLIIRTCRTVAPVINGTCARRYVGGWGSGLADTQSDVLGVRGAWTKKAISAPTFFVVVMVDRA